MVFFDLRLCFLAGGQNVCDFRSTRPSYRLKICKLNVILPMSNAMYVSVMTSKMHTCELQMDNIDNMCVVVCKNVSDISLYRVIPQ